MNQPAGKAGSWRWRPLAAAALAFLLVAGLAYLLTRSGAGELPPMPRASFPPGEAKGALDGLARRAAGYRSSEPERNLERLADLGRIETGREPDPDRGEHVALAMKAFSEAAQSSAAADPGHYLGFGDHLAGRFGQAVSRFLEAARRDGLARARIDQRGSLEEIERLGGSFIQRAVERGLLGEDGRLDGPAFLPAVLFLTRWRSLAGQSRVLGLEPVERRAYLDFIVAFSSPDAVALRLEAVESLAALDPAYDAVLARALVLYEGGRADEAHAILMAAIEAGRDDPAVERFARFLAP
jgi:tetratricopeptide (TPR) repeat protein